MEFALKNALTTKFTMPKQETVTASLVLEESTEFAKSVQLEPYREPMETAALVESTNNWSMANVFAPKDLFPTNSESVLNAMKYQELLCLTETALCVLEI